MKKKYRLVVITIVVLMTMVAIALSRTPTFQRKSAISPPTPQIVATMTPSPIPTPDPEAGFALKVYTNDKEGYSLKVPADWEKIIEKDGLVTFVPKANAEPLGTMKEISIMTGTPFPAKQQLSTQKHFDAWANTRLEDTIAPSDFQKAQDELIDGVAGETVLNLRKDKEWNMVTWLRKDNNNYYISIKGGPVFGGIDTGVYQYLVYTLKFTPQN